VALSRADREEDSDDGSGEPASLATVKDWRAVTVERRRQERNTPTASRRLDIGTVNHVHRLAVWKRAMEGEDGDTRQ